MRGGGNREGTNLMFVNVSEEGLGGWPTGTGLLRVESGMLYPQLGEVNNPFLGFGTNVRLEQHQSSGTTETKTKIKPGFIGVHSWGRFTSPQGWVREVTPRLRQAWCK